MKLNYKRTILIGLAFLSISSFWQVYDSIIPLILKNTFLMGETLAGFIMSLDNILALFLLPLFGTLSDKVSTRFGKRTPFIIFGTIASIIFMTFLPISDNLINFPMFIIFLLLTLVALSTYRSPAVALMPDLTPKPLRSKANAIINLMGALGGVFSLVLMAFFIPETGKPNYLTIFVPVSLLMAICVIVLVLTIKENKLNKEMQAYVWDDDEENNNNNDESTKMPKELFRSLLLILLSVAFWYMAYNGVTTAFSRYVQNYLGQSGGAFASNLLLATVVAVITFIPAGLLGSKIGRRKTILIGVVIMFATFFVGSFYRSYSATLNILFILIGMGWAMINVNSYPMVVEISKGSDIGKYTGYYYSFSMAAQVFTPILSGILLEHVGYHTLFPYATFFMVLAFCTMFFVRHGEAKDSTDSKAFIDDMEDL